MPLRQRQEVQKVLHARVRSGWAVRCNTLEEQGEPLQVEGDEIYRPHQIISVLVR